ncbi:hypothetical protein BSKO_05644 [Bryopsis sp. KO-2023]|nr:hypothetical protein BSKO_05644 [Bryopsis sp. KO-2023]
MVELLLCTEHVWVSSIRERVRALFRDAQDFAVKRAEEIIAAILEDLPWNKGLLSETKALRKILEEKETKIRNMKISIDSFQLRIQDARAQASCQSGQYWEVVRKIEEKLSHAGERVLGLEADLRNSKRENQEKALELSKCSFQLQRANVEAEKAGEKLKAKSAALGNSSRLLQNLKEESRILEGMLRQVELTERQPIPTFEFQMLHPFLAARQEIEETKHVVEIDRLRNIAVQKNHEKAEAERMLLKAERQQKRELDQKAEEHKKLEAELKLKHTTEIHEAEQKAMKVLQMSQVHNSLFANIQAECKQANARIAELEKQLQQVQRESTQSTFNFRQGGFYGFPDMHYTPFQVENANPHSSNNSFSHETKERELHVQQLKKVKKRRGGTFGSLMFDTMHNDGRD